MNNSTNSDNMLRDMAKSHTESATATALMLKNIFDVMSVISISIKSTETYMQQMKTAREAFYAYSTKAFIVVFFALLGIIALLLKELNVKGADAIQQVSKTAVSAIK